MDDNWLQRLFEAQEVLSRLTAEELRTVDEEARWVPVQKVAGRAASPEQLLENAPLLMRLVTQMDDEEGL